jgi:uncharacterized membrane protein
MPFLTEEEKEQVVQAITEAEKNTSGEIKVHIESQSQKPPLERAMEVFVELGIHQTEARNGVLIYICLQSKQLAILGDEGINNVVEPDFWECTRNLILDHFKNQEYKEGLVKGILRAGKRLKAFFPYQSDDTNELSNDISFN